MSRSFKRSRREEPGASSPASYESRAGKPTHFPAPLLQAIKSVDLNFRSLSTCNRCRIRKHRCDQRLPTCASCEKVGAPCMGYDPVTKIEVPRSYVYHLETRVTTLESILDQHQIPYPQTNATATGVAAGSVSNTPQTELEAERARNETQSTEIDDKSDACPDTIDMIVGSMGIPSTQVPLVNGTNSDDCASSISFAHMAFSSLRSSVAVSSDSCRGTVTQRSLLVGSNSKDCTAVRPITPFPDRMLGRRLVQLYFHHSNPMYPILHRKDFGMLFDRACASQQCTARELFLLYIVFAIGAGIHLTDDSSDWDDANAANDPEPPESRRGKQDRQQQVQPEDYYATAITHLESISTSNAGRRRDSGLEELQAVLLLAAFALLRPASPGLWYIVGSALRRAVDLGLYSDDQAVPKLKDDDANSEQMKLTRDFRRRLWWCAYSFDRLISTCAGRPCSVPDSVIATQFPSLLDDDFISPDGFDDSGEGSPDLSYKHISHHYFRLRMLQSEISQVIQAAEAQRTRRYQEKERSRPHQVRDPILDAHGELRSPFLRNHASLKPWRDDMEHRLQRWRDTAPEESTSGVTFPTEYFELNYWQTIIFLYSDRQQTTPPVPSTAQDDHDQELPSEASWTLDGVIAADNENKAMFSRIAEAGQAVLRLYRELHLMNLVNYTYLDTHQLFTASTAFLSAVWLSPTVRQRLSVEEIDLTVLAATSVLNDLVEKCPHAAACRDAIQKMSKATLKRCRLSRKGMSSSTRRSLPLPRARDSLLPSYSLYDGPPSASSHSISDDPSRTGAASSVSERLVSIAGSGSKAASGLRPRRVGDGTDADTHSQSIDPFLPQQTVISSGPRHFLDDYHHSPTTAPPSILLPELDRSDMATDLDYQHHDPNAASNLLNMSWNDDYFGFDASAQVGLFDSFFFGDGADL